MGRRRIRPRGKFIVSIAGAIALWAGGTLVRAIVTNYTLVEALHPEKSEHLDQNTLADLVRANHGAEAFAEAFEHGDELFETEFRSMDGVGANVGDGSRFTRIPRADLAGTGQWASHTPRRATGPNASSCNACHIQLFDDGSGAAVGNVHRDPQHSGNLSHFIQRNTPHTFALGAVQRLAEEMTADLLKTRDLTAAQACSFGKASGDLRTKGISYGTIRATRASGTSCSVTFDTSAVAGVSADLIVRPFQWKGSFATVRAFNRDAANNELGMQAVEFAGDDVDGDGDGIVNELSIGDITALTVYLAAQPRPTTKLELARWNLIGALPAGEVDAIKQGGKVFEAIGCASCHAPQLLLNDPIFSEPSRQTEYRDARFPAGQDPVSRGVDPRIAVTFDLTRDQPDNRVVDENGRLVFALGSFVRDAQGRAIIGLFGDLKRHDMGARLAESIDEEGTGAATFLTRNLWGVGSTAPYMHDGRATTLTEAILEHGGEANASRSAFLARSLGDKQALVAFLNNLVLFKLVDNEVVVPPPTSVKLSSRLHFRRPGRGR
jgi:Di-haem oxidoreductase, putative peroxidase